MLEFFHDAIEILWFVTEKPVLTCNIFTEAREIKPFLVCGKYIIFLQQDNVFGADIAPLQGVLWPLLKWHSLFSPHREIDHRVKQNKSRQMGGEGERIRGVDR